MKLALLLFLAQLSLLILLAGCQGKESAIFNSSKWHVGDTLTYSVWILETDFLRDTVTGRKEVLYQADLELIELGEHNVLKWHVRLPVQRPDSLITPIERSLADTLDYKEAFQIVYRTDESGQYEEVMNWPQLEKYSDSLWNNMARAYMPDSSKHEILKKLKETFMSRSAVEAKMTRDIAALHVVYHKIQEETESQSDEEVVGINNLTLTQKARRQIQENNADYALVKIAQELDATQIKKQIDPLVSDLSGDTLHTADMLMSDEIGVDYNKITGWPGVVEYWRSISIGDRRKTIGIVLKRIER